MRAYDDTMTANDISIYRDEAGWMWVTYFSIDQTWQHDPAHTIVDREMAAVGDTARDRIASALRMPRVLDAPGRIVSVPA